MTWDSEGRDGKQRSVPSRLVSSSLFHCITPNMKTNYPMPGLALSFITFPNLIIKEFLYLYLEKHRDVARLLSSFQPPGHRE